MISSLTPAVAKDWHALGTKHGQEDAATFLETCVFETDTLAAENGSLRWGDLTIPSDYQARIDLAVESAVIAALCAGASPQEMLVYRQSRAAARHALIEFYGNERARIHPPRSGGPKAARRSRNKRGRA
ncbi:hypothetical protein [Phreatobacter sp. AB_2022a]|uniref:hypothetical protein n=1 Tax=Phreatobacter sp. AB_2022a TaxID=3003134 RepID=UPI002287266A|nr:hypothetical protein [Phreatobacter sp. AB_2022a]MCZ0734576.1 hypothetical protein [Phreatobacter sp. AB_2022a]